MCSAPSIRRLTGRGQGSIPVCVLPDYARLNSTAASHNADQARGSLAGRTISIKDNIVTRDSPTTASSRALSGYSSPFAATIVKLLRKNGVSSIIKSGLDEFGMGSHAQNSYHGAIYNIYHRGGVPLSPGGSSGGCAVAVASGEAWAALGTDTGGSVRLPAAYTGVVGFKPSYGLLSRWGVIQYANSLDTVGILSNKVADARVVFQSLDAYDSQDPTSLSNLVRQRIRDQGSSGTRSLRIGIPDEYNIEELSPRVHAAYVRILMALQSAGHSLHQVSLPSTRQALSAYYVLAPAEAASNLAKYDGVRYGHQKEMTDETEKHEPRLYATTRGQSFGPEVRRRILLGNFTLSSSAMDNYFVQAQRVRRSVQRDFDNVFAKANPLIDQNAKDAKTNESVEILLIPTAPTLPPTVEEVTSQSPVESYMNDVFTVPASLAGLPAVSVPVELSLSEAEGLEKDDISSAGMQIVGQFGDDETVLRAAEEVERLFSEASQ